MCNNCLLDPKMDFIFKRIFGSENDTDILIRFLNAILEAKHTTGNYDPIVEVQILNPELPKSSLEDKHSILDIKAKTSKNEVIDIEIQRKDEGNILKRAIFYLSNVVTEQLESADNYNKINRSIAIVITNFKTKFIAKKHFHTICNLTDVLKDENNENAIITDLLELHFIELPKMKEFDKEDVLQLFLQFLKDPNDEDVEDKSTKIVELSKAKQKLARLSRDPKTRQEFQAREKALKDKTTALETSRDEGIEIGIERSKDKVEKAEKAEAKAKADAEKFKANAEKALKAEAKAKADADAKAEAAAEKTKLNSARSLLEVLDDQTIASSIGLELSQVQQLRSELEG